MSLDLVGDDRRRPAAARAVHTSCTLHMSQPPVVRERRVMYTSFRLPDPSPEAARAARARLRAVRERAPVTVSQPPSATPPQ